MAMGALPPSAAACAATVPAVERLRELDRRVERGVVRRCAVHLVPLAAFVFLAINPYGAT
jgi:hypothetical protein